jgi:hypothetical protein
MPSRNGRTNAWLGSLSRATNPTLVTSYSIDLGGFLRVGCERPRTDETQKSNKLARLMRVDLAAVRSEYQLWSLVVYGLKRIFPRQERQIP